jgi:hypothetical protein
VPLLEACGMLMLSDSRIASRGHGTVDFAGQTAMLAQRFGIAHELLDAAAIAQRFRNSPATARMRWATTNRAPAMCGRSAPSRCS